MKLQKILLENDERSFQLEPPLAMSIALLTMTGIIAHVNDNNIITQYPKEMFEKV